MKRRVVVTGMGCVTPVGSDLDSSWRNIRAGVSGVGPITLFDAGGFPIQIAAEVKGWDAARLGDHADQFGHAHRQTQFLIAAAFEAVAQAGLECRGDVSGDISGGEIDPARFGVYLGCGEVYRKFQQFGQSVLDSLEEGKIDDDKFRAAAERNLSVELEEHMEMNLPPAYLAGLFGAEGPNTNYVTACASSTQSIGEATEIIRRGDADVMLAGGAHGMVHAMGISGLYRLSALSTRNDQPKQASRPFDRMRDGFVDGEGAGIVVLEDLDHARNRGAKILGEILGYGSSADAFRVTDPHPEGLGAARAMRAALADAQLEPAQIDYISAHGTSTELNDRVETMAVKLVFDRHAYHVPISSIKSMIGHLTTGAGVIELIVCLLAIRDQLLPPTINYEHPDPNCDLDYVPNEARSAKCQRTMSNNFGFGGQNATLIASSFIDK